MMPALFSLLLACACITSHLMQARQMLISACCRHEMVMHVQVALGSQQAPALLPQQLPAHLPSASLLLHPPQVTHFETTQIWSQRTV